MTRFAGLFRALGGEQEASAEDTSVPGWEEYAEAEVFTLLFVDDEPGVLKALERIFIDENYRILTAANARQALDLLEQGPVHLVICDHRMPGMTGAELLREIKNRWPQIIRIMLTGYADVHSIMGAVNEGAVYKFITKPWNDEDLRLSVSLGLQQYVLIQENRRLRDLTRTQQAKIKDYTSLLSENRGILGSILEKSGLVLQESYMRALRERQGGEFATEALDRLGILSEEKTAKLLRDQLKLPIVDLKELDPPREVARLLPRELCQRHRILPVRLEGNRLTLAMADPSDIFKCDHIAQLSGLKVQATVALASDIAARLKSIYGEEKGGKEGFLEDMPDFDPIDEVDIVIEEEEIDLNVQELLSSSEIPPVVRIVNAIISEAVRYRASDIHFEPKSKHSIVRYRIDGILHNKIKIPSDLHAATVSRIKVMANLDIAERRKPQDGRITVKAGTRLVDIRISTMPTISGEKIVLRILDKSSAILPLNGLGLLPTEHRILQGLIKKPQGILIATGPTGSGKTTFLYSILNEMLHSEKNFETIEDPVEYHLEDANQVFVREKIGLSFASVLRATLRQDPDVILVGEVRDMETADVAFKAALTGHMVLTTLHTNSSVATVTRLMDLGVQPHLIASALEGFVAQRLVRRICRHCKVAEDAAPDVLELLRIPAAKLAGKTYRGKGCNRCNQTGYEGRIGIFEVFMMNDDFRHFICESYREAELVAMARAAGMHNLVDNGIEKVRQGETTPDELLRVIGPQLRHERTCDHCGGLIETRFPFCPFCGHFRQKICMHCKMPLEKEWNLCPFCGKRHDPPLAP